MDVRTYRGRDAMSQAAAAHAARLVRDAIGVRGVARVIAATGASQFGFLDALTTVPGIDWARVELFHLDEYVGIPADHPASFRRYLRERLVDRTGITRFHALDAERDPQETADRVGRALGAAPIDLACVGIGENGHLAFNDPPADFASEQPYLVVALDEACRQQQVGEGWFATLADVPSRALSMSVRQILKSREILCVVPDSRKATAVGACLEGDISPMAPASILRTHGRTTVYLDRDSAAHLSPAVRGTVL